MAKLFSFPPKRDNGDLRCLGDANIVCPFCGMVWKEGKPYGAASDFVHTLEDWAAYGYELTACPGCIKAGKAPDESSLDDETTKENLRLLSKITKGVK